MTNRPQIEVIFLPYFLKALKHLRRRYPRIAADLKTLTDQLETGETPGDRIQHVGHIVYKVRLRNTDSQRGKRGGYRVIYYVKTQSRIFLLTIYAKTRLADIHVEEIRRIIDEMGDA